MYGAPTMLTPAPVVIAMPYVTGPLPKPYLGTIRGAGLTFQCSFGFASQVNRVPVSALVIKLTDNPFSIPQGPGTVQSVTSILS